MQSDWYRAVFPNTRISEARSMTTDFNTSRRGVRICTTVGGTMTRRGGSLVIIDDPRKPADEIACCRFFGHEVIGSGNEHPGLGRLVNNHRPVDPIGHIAPAEAEANCCAAIENLDMDA
ncbi:hypothetical protein GC173_11725 [bacterium]|nr:hypothetical protein [bacterium]